jgi:hypothetical protein
MPARASIRPFTMFPARRPTGQSDPVLALRVTALAVPDNRAAR